jgi:general L-amino acid transport system substrate-binding protein
VWRGLDADLCRILAVAVFGDPNKVTYVPQNFTQVITALQSGETDVVTRTITWTVSREGALGLEFPALHYYSGQAFMVAKRLGVKSPRDLNGATICVQSGTTTEANLNDYFRSNGLQFTQVPFEDQALMYASYEAGRCDAITTEPPTLAARRSVFKVPDDHVILADIISKEPFGPAVRRGDDEWRKIVRFSVYAVIAAEELGITSKNVGERVAKATNPEERRFLGLEGDIGTRMGLKNSWTVDVISQVGNYSEIWERSIGPQTPLRLERGLNKLWNQGGLLLAPPWR